MAAAGNLPGTKLPATAVSGGVRTVSMLLRAAFIVTLMAITVRVSLPQSETIWTAYDTPGDLVRLALGLVLCVWLAIQLFWTPREPSSYRTWLYLGSAAVPFALICLVAIW
jgi:hypothetical protein